MVILFTSVNCYMNCKHDLCNVLLVLSMDLGDEKSVLKLGD